MRAIIASEDHDPVLTREIAQWSGEADADAALVSVNVSTRLSSDVFRMATEQAGDGIALTDALGRFVFMDERHATMFGFENRDALLGLPWTTLYTAEEAERFASDVFPQLDDPGKRWRGTAYGIGKGGRPVRQEVSLTTQETGGILCITRDIGARIDAEAQRRRLVADLDRAQRVQTVGAMASGIGHNLCNVLTAVGVVDLEREGLGAPAKKANQLDSLRQWIDQASQLAQCLATMGATSPTIGGRTELCASVESAVELVGLGLGPDTRVRLRQVEDFVAVPIDDGSVAQIIVNLVVNARDSRLPESTITVEVATPRTASVFSPPFAQCRAEQIHQVSTGMMPRGDVALLRVVDEGTGIPPAVLDRALEPFFTTKLEARGNGLGLSTVVAAVRDAGGMFELFSAEGVGTEARVWLPRLETTPVRFAEAGELVVNVIDTELAEVIDAALSAAGAKLSCCANHHALLARLGESEPIGAILVDVETLPEPAGMRLEMLRTVGAGRPLVTIVGAGIDGATLNAIRARCDGVLQRPFSGERLVRLLSGVLARDTHPQSGSSRVA